MDEKLFLLGGKDLEMQEIARMLAMHAIPFADADLVWDTAKLSAYESQLCANPNKKIYGVELITDICPPANYILIDHHNDRTDNLSALEQVAALLGINLTREQQLIAENDKAYIDGMLRMGATRAEVERIRRMDRAAQGVTERDEELVEHSLRNNTRKIGDLVVVETTAKRFSPICDRLYPCPQLLIYTDKEWTYYGKERNRLICLFELLIKEKKVYYGGTDCGYIGITVGVHTENEIKQDVELIINCVKNV